MCLRLQSTYGPYRGEAKRKLMNGLLRSVSGESATVRPAQNQQEIPALPTLNVFDGSRTGEVAIHVLVADDHPLLPCGLKQILAHEPDFAPPGEAKDSEEVLKMLGEQHWDALVLDIAMPGSSGLEALTEIRRRFPLLPVVILSVFPEEQFAVRAILCGATCYLAKTQALAELFRACFADQVDREVCASENGAADGSQQWKSDFRRA